MQNETTKQIASENNDIQIVLIKQMTHFMLRGLCHHVVNYFYYDFSAETLGSFRISNEMESTTLSKLSTTGNLSKPSIICRICLMNESSELER
jgi:hypothetical protein